MSGCKHWQKAGGPWSGRSTCPKCGQEFDDYRAGSWDWEAHLCPACTSYASKLRLDENKAKPPKRR